MGAFGAASVRWNGLELPPSSVSVRFANGSPTVRLDELTRSTPLVLPVGVRSTFDLRGVEVGAGPQRVRLDLHSVAIPPRVWFEFSEEVRPVEVRA